MSEDEFVVLLEHAGITEVSDDGGQEFLEKNLLLEWLAREGIELFGNKFLFHNDGNTSGKGNGVVDGIEQAAGDDRGAEADVSAPPGTTAEEGLRYALAQRILEKLVEREWLSPIEFDYDEDETEVRDKCACEDLYTTAGNAGVCLMGVFVYDVGVEGDAVRRPPVDRRGVQDLH